MAEPFNDHSTRDRIAALLLGGGRGLLEVMLDQSKRRREEQYGQELQEGLTQALSPPPTTQMPGPQTPVAPVPQTVFGDRGSGPQLETTRLDPVQSGLPTLSPSRPDSSRAIQALIQAQSRGLDIGPYSQLFEAGRREKARSSYLDGVPEEDRAIAEMNPEGYADNDLKLRTPLIENLGGGVAISVDRKTGNVKRTFSLGRRDNPPSGYQWTEAQTLAPIPGGPADPAVILKEAAARRAPDDDKPTTSRNIGAIQAKLMRGEKLTPGEQRVYDDYRTARLSAFDRSMGLGDEDDGGGGYGGGGPPPAAARPATAAPAGGIPAEAAAKLKEGEQTQFANGQLWTKRGGKPVRLK